MKVFEVLVTVARIMIKIVALFWAFFVALIWGITR
jgi:hypothetical protein